MESVSKISLLSKTNITDGDGDLVVARNNDWGGLCALCKFISTNNMEKGKNLPSSLFSFVPHTFSCVVILQFHV